MSINKTTQNQKATRQSIVPTGQGTSPQQAPKQSRKKKTTKRKKK
jgi:hypothetical protein